MKIDPFHQTPATKAAAADPANRLNPNPSFKQALKNAFQSKIDARKQAEEAASGLVSQALILPILKQVRRSPFNTEGPFSAGTGEKTFGPQFDMQLADRIAHSPRLGIKKALANRMLKHGVAAVKKELKLHG